MTPVSSGRREQVRAALQSLRIERGAPPELRSGWSWRGPAIAAVILCALGLAWVLWRPAPSAPIRVEVVYASHPGADSAADPVLSGAGYVVTGDRYVSLGARVPGRVTEYLVEEGEEVAAGQPLVRLDDRHYAAAVREAEASRRVAEANARYRRVELSRLRRLHSRDAASQAALDAMENQLAVAAAEVDRLSARVAQLRLDLEETLVRAPTDGMVLEKLKEVGEMAVPGGFAGSGELIRIANLEELRAEVDVNETDLAKVLLGQPSEIVPDAFPERRYTAEVAKLYPQINRQKGTLRVEVRILSPDEVLRPDMSVRVHFLSERSDTSEPSHVTALRAAIREDDTGHYVWTVTNARLARRAVDVGDLTGEGRVEVKLGLEGGEALVVGDADGFDEKTPVEIAP